MKPLKLRNFEQVVQRNISRISIAVNELGKIFFSFVRQIAQFLILLMPIFCEASSFPKWQDANKKFDINAAGSVGSCVRVVDFTEQPITYGGAGFVEVVTAVAPKVEAKPGQNAKQETNEVKRNDVVRYGLGDLIKEHGIGLFLSFLIGFLCVGEFYPRK